jgi:hypothetical protein
MHDSSPPKRELKYGDETRFLEPRIVAGYVELLDLYGINKRIVPIQHSAAGGSRTLIAGYWFYYG